MSGLDLRLFIAHIAIPFATGATLGALFICAIYCLNVGGMRTILLASGDTIFEFDPIPFAFGALAIGTKQALGFVIDD